MRHTEYRDKEMEQKTVTGTEMRGNVGIGQSLGGEMGQGMTTETQRWERVRGQGHRDGKKHLSRDTDMRQGHEVQRQSVGTEMEQGTRTQGWDLQDFLLTRDLLRSLLGQGRGLAL